MGTSTTSATEQVVPTFTANGLSVLQLPPECLERIFSYLNGPQLAAAGQVCRTWRQVAATPALWRHCTYERWGHAQVTTVETIVATVRNIAIAHMCGWCTGLAAQADCAYCPCRYAGPQRGWFQTVPRQDGRLGWLADALPSAARAAHMAAARGAGLRIWLLPHRCVDDCCVCMRVVPYRLIKVCGWSLCAWRRCGSSLRRFRWRRSSTGHLFDGVSRAP